MLLRSKSFTWTLLFLMTITVAGCASDLVVEEGALQEWFWSRLGWYLVVSVILGIAVSFRLCRMPIRAPLLDCIRAARLRFIQWESLLAVLTPLFLSLDAYFTQPFGEGIRLTGSGVFFLVTMDWRTLRAMFVVALAFYATVGIFTRFFLGRTCNCKSAFIPKGSG